MKLQRDLLFVIFEERQGNTDEDYRNWKADERL